jgi:Predicted metal-binding protein related to the C-terminal domain of SecA
MTAPVYNYHGYKLYNVYQKTTPDLRREIVAFWQRNKAIPDLREAERRAHEVVYLIRNPAEVIVGVSSVYTARAGNPPASYYFYRMFIQPGDRIYGMMRLVTIRTRDFLRDEVPKPEPRGLVIITENPKLMRKGMQRVFARFGFEFVSKTQRGLDVWVYRFEQSPAPLARNDPCPCASGLKYKNCCGLTMLMLPEPQQVEQVEDQFQMAQAAFNRGDFLTAEQGVIEVLNQIPGHVRALLLLYLIHHQANRHRPAEILFRRLVSLIFYTVP